MQADPIPREDLRERTVYRIRSRNLEFGVWVAERSGFIGVREKFGDQFLFVEFLNDPPGSGTAIATEDMTIPIPDEIEMVENFLIGTGSKRRWRDNKPLLELLQQVEADQSGRYR